MLLGRLFQKAPVTKVDLIDGVGVAFKGASAITAWCSAFDSARDEPSPHHVTTPREFLEGLQTGVPYPLKIRVDLSTCDNGFVASVLGTRPKDDAAIVSVDLSVMPGHFGILSHADVHMECDRGRGLLKPLMSNVVNYMRGASAKSLFVGADNTYTWVLYGFKPNSHAWQDKMVPEIAMRLKNVKRRLTAADIGRVKKILKSPDPVSVRALAEIRDVTINGVPLGRFLLSDLSRWQGSLDLTNKHDIAFFKRHIEGADRPTGHSVRAQDLHH